MTNQSTQKQSPTAQVSEDGYALGRTSGQRGAEILAALRHQLYPSPETEALQRFSGQIFARLLRALERNSTAYNFIQARQFGIQEFVIRNFNDTSGIIVEIGAGLSPRGVFLARQFPEATVIEIDLPDVVKTKKYRLRKGYGFDVPKNLEWLGTDLGVTPLTEVLGERLVDVVAAEGLNAYFPPDEITQIATNVRESLKPAGVYVSDIPWRVGMNQFKNATRFFSRQAGTYKGIVEDEAHAEQLMLSAGYENVDVLKFSSLSHLETMPDETIDFSFLVAATNSVPEAE